MEINSLLEVTQVMKKFLPEKMDNTLQKEKQSSKQASGSTSKFSVKGNENVITKEY